MAAAPARLRRCAAGTIVGVTDRYDPWLDPRVFPDADDLTDVELVFLDGVRDGMAGCRTIPDTGREEDGRLLVSVSVSVRDEADAGWLIVADYGVLFDGVTAEADWLSGMRFLPEPTPAHCTFTGAPADAGVRSGEWLLRWVGRPVVRREWLRQSRVVMQEWAFADSGDVLCIGGAFGPERRELKCRHPDRVIQARTM
jgi:hypothetical protein